MHGIQLKLAIILTSVCEINFRLHTSVVCYFIYFFRLQVNLYSLSTNTLSIYLYFARHLSNLIISISKLVWHALLEAAVITQLCQVLLFIPPILSVLSLSTCWPCRDPLNFTMTRPNLLTFRRCSINNVVRRERKRQREREREHKEGERAYSAFECVPR